MSELKIVLVHAGERADLAVTTGTKAWELFKDDADVIAARVNGEAARTCPTSCQDGDEVEGVAIDSPDGHDILRHSTAHVMAQAVQDLFPDARLGIGPPIDRRLLLRLRRRDPVRARGPRQDRDPDAQDHQGGAALLPAGHHRRRRARRAQGRALQDRADRPQGRGQERRRRRGGERRGRRRRAHHLRQHPPRRRGRLERPVPRPAPADHQADPGVQADAVRGGVLARRREEQAAPAHLRHRLGVQGGARGAPAPDRGGRAPRPPQARAATSTCSASPTRSAPASRSSTPRAG